MVRVLSLSESDSKLFGIWCISASLQLQLKPYHQPCEIVETWQDVLGKLAKNTVHTQSAFNSEGVTHMEEQPTLYLKRDGLVHQALEKKVESELALQLLCDQLTFDVLYSFYPSTVAEAVDLAAVALKMTKGSAAEKADLKVVPGCGIPTHLEGIHWQWTWRRKVWKAFLKLQSLPGDGTTKWKKEYLALGHKWAYYGAPCYYGGIEADVPGLPDNGVRVGVNLDGIHVIDDHDNELILSLGFNQFTFNSYGGSFGSAKEDSFVIEYKTEKGMPEDMVIWGPQAGLIDSLVTGYIRVLGDWTDFMESRKANRKSFLPQPSVKGRRGTSDGIADMFTLKRPAKGRQVPASHVPFFEASSRSSDGAIAE
jgi:hypothetical protein